MLTLPLKIKNMFKIFEIKPIYVDIIPDILNDGELYISNKYNIAIHLCACGCGEQVVTPLRQDKWIITNNGGKVTLRPSIGNWTNQHPYHAHYYITDNRIEDLSNVNKIRPS